MTRRKDDGLLMLIAAMPWPIGIIGGVLAYLGFRYGIGLLLVRSANPSLAALGKQAAAGSLHWVAWTFLAIFWIGALVSYIRRRSRIRLLDTRGGLDSLRDIDWRHFEMLVGEAFRRQGFGVVENGLGGADGGIDLVLRRDGDVTLVQCKQWRKQRVDVRIVREMFGLMTHHRAQAVKIVSVGDFTAAAERFARDKPIELVHGKRLLSMIRDVQSSKPVDRGMRDTADTSDEMTPNAPATGSAETPACPRCGQVMARRAHRKTGQAFWGCSTFPSCRGTRAMQRP